MNSDETDATQSNFTATARYRNIEKRACVLHTIRTTLSSRGYIEVETPVRIAAPLPERYIDAPATKNAYLAPSPERDMKKLIAEGFSAIFQISKCFRKGERGKKHCEEFTMLEWYRIGADCQTLIEDAKAIICTAVQAANNSPDISYRGSIVSCEKKWEHLSVDEAYEKYANITLPDSPDDALFDTHMVNDIEPHLGQEAPCVLFNYPRSVSPLSATCTDNPHRAQRCELYIAGLEIANGCVEQNDPDILVHRLNEEQMHRAKRGADPYPPFDEFIKETASMPSAAGMALGVDRLMMIVCDTDCIDDVVTYIE